MARGGEKQPNAGASGYAWGLLALLACPCHLPLIALLLSGTAAGAFLADHSGVAMVAAGALFALFAALAVRAFNRRR